VLAALPCCHPRHSLPAAHLPSQVDIALIDSLLSYICEEGPFRREGSAAAALGVGGGGPAVMGAVLVFLPGWDEIMRLKDRLEASPWFGGSRWAARHAGRMLRGAGAGRRQGMMDDYDDD
jgi:hypothetical protein